MRQADIEAHFRFRQHLEYSFGIWNTKIKWQGDVRVPVREIQSACVLKKVPVTKKFIIGSKV